MADVAKNRERASEWYYANRERVLERRAARWRADEAWREQRKTYLRRWYRENRERLLARARDRYRLKSDEVRSYQRSYYEANRGYVQARNARNRADRLKAPGDCSVEQLLARVAYYGDRCWVCRGDADCIDHVIPLIRGGSNWPANLRPICRSCNSRKGTRDPKEFLRG